jgi:hypothetical protein
MNILLIEPDYKNKYPPLGLMKISTFHKQKGDNVLFYKGCDQNLRNFRWDRIYISTLFTFHWNKTIKTIKYYLKSTNNSKNLIIGGVLATIMKNNIEELFDITVIQGLLNEPGKLGLSNDHIIDTLLPDYSIIDPNVNTILDYKYPTDNCYIAYATRGCIRKCSFCAVPIVEPVFSNSLSIKKQVEAIRDYYGEKKDLLLMDNNILASKCFPEIIKEIKDLGFEKGATLTHIKNGRKQVISRFVDFNQGLDSRLLDENNIKLLSEIAVKPLRIAFDDIKQKNTYIKKVRLAADNGIKYLSNYILFNYEDTPSDFHERLKINIELNEEFASKGLETRIWSFPMKYSPVLGQYAIDRKFVGKHWNKKYLRGIQNILLVTHGLVGPKKPFFEKAFGKDFSEFIRILMLPEDYILSRIDSEANKLPQKLSNKIKKLSENEKDLLNEIILNNDFTNIKLTSENKHLDEIINIYRPHS